MPAQFMPAQSISAQSISAQSISALDPAAALAKLAAAFDRRFALWNAHGFAGIREDWLARAHPRGTRLTIRRPDGELSGRFADLDGDGTLILETDSGFVKVAAGDVHLPDAHLGVQES
jgi:BirA family biotin operon repressor/biotin-[acetyl-CoA-carboxylase] ligase